MIYSWWAQKSRIRPSTLQTLLNTFSFLPPFFLIFDPISLLKLSDTNIGGIFRCDIRVPGVWKSLYTQFPGLETNLKFSKKSTCRPSSSCPYRQKTSMYPISRQKKLFIARFVVTRFQDTQGEILRYFYFIVKFSGIFYFKQSPTIKTILLKWQVSKCFRREMGPKLETGEPKMKKCVRKVCRVLSTIHEFVLAHHDYATKIKLKVSRSKLDLKYSNWKRPKQILRHKMFVFGVTSGWSLSLL